MKLRSLHNVRRIVQIGFLLLILLMPILDILRYDTATKELIVFGKVWGLGLKQSLYADQGASGSFHIALNVFLKVILPWVFALSLFPLLGFFTGRFFCGWFCPAGTLFELIDYLTLKFLGRRSIYGKKPNDPIVAKWNKLALASIAPLGIVVVLLIGMALVGYLVAPRTIWSQVINRNFTFGVKAGIIGVSMLTLIVSLLVRHTFCKFVCGVGLLQALFGWFGPMSLRPGLDTARISECTNCKKCERVCFMDIAPRKNKLDASCVNCGECIDACNEELGYGKGLFHFSFGKQCLLPESNCKSLKRIHYVPSEGK